jgi:type I restriction enzyme S subunit
MGQDPRLPGGRCMAPKAPWEYQPLDRILVACQYGTSSSSDADGNVPLVGMKDLRDGCVVVDESVRTFASEAEISQLGLKANDILFNRTNSIALVGKAGIVRQDTHAVFASYLVRLVVDRDQYNPNFLNYYLATTQAQETVLRLATRGVGQANINPRQLRKRMYVPVPYLAEQRAIVGLLVTAEESVRAVDELIEKKAAYKKALAEDLLTGRRRFAGFADAWPVFHLGDMFDERVEVDRADLKLLAVTGSDGVVDRDSLVKRDTSSKDKSKYLRVCPGDIAYNTMRMWQGVCGISPLEGIVSPAYTVCTPRTALILPRYAEQLFKLPLTIHKFKRYSQGLVDDTLNLKFHHFAEIKVEIPCLEEQGRIADVLRTLDEEVALLGKQREALNEQKKGLMQKLLTGEVRLKEFRE